MKVSFNTTFYGTTDVDTETGEVSFEIDQIGDSDGDEYVVVGKDGGCVWEGERSEAKREAEAGDPQDEDVAAAVLALEQVKLAEKAIQERGYFPTAKVDAETVAAYTARKKAEYRQHLINRIEAGDLAAAKSLKERFGESIRLKVEIVQEAA